MVLARGMTLASWGVVIGLTAALAVTRLIRGLLFGVEPLDSVSFATPALLLVLVAGLASYLPARRAAGTDPLTSLRSE
jgi:putative ABC transport system permease protein